MTPDEQVLEFWFGGESRRGKARAKWFSKDDEFDAQMRERFGELHAKAARRELEGWRASPEPMLALVLLLDQFSRNLHRGDARAFAQDPHARECARQALERGDDLGFLPVERQFLYMPFEHSEDLAMQDRAVELFTALAAQTGVDSPLPWAEKHRDVIRRFGRFPHRNEILGRTSTPEELAFLTQPGSSF